MKPSIRTMIVDDEPAARRVLRAMLNDSGLACVVGESASVADAACLAAACDPELLLLDVTMPTRSGFELLPLLNNRPQVIFVTAFDEYAVRAFEIHAIDYLLKPIRRERLFQALERAQGLLPQRTTMSATEFPAQREIILQAEGHVRMVPVESIIYVKAVGNYTQVHLVGSTRMLIRRSMEQWEELLPAKQFFRPHRSLIVNLQLMRGVRPVSRDVAELSFEGCKAPIAVGRKASLLLRRMLLAATPAEAQQPEAVALIA